LWIDFSFSPDKRKKLLENTRHGNFYPDSLNLLELQQTTRDRKLKMNKYVIRRAVVGIVITPLVALVWLFGIALLIGAGAEPTATANQVWLDGLWLGVAVSVVFAGSAWSKK
jgi:hypothetical protein